MADSKEEAESVMVEVGSKRKDPHTDIHDDGSFAQPHKQQSKQPSKNKKRKTRAHPKEAGHNIEDLPSFSSSLAENGGGKAPSGEEIVKKLGLSVSGAGKGVEVWFVGAREADKNDESDHGEEGEAASKA